MVGGCKGQCMFFFLKVEEFLAVTCQKGPPSLFSPRSSGLLNHTERLFLNKKRKKKKASKSNGRVMNSRSAPLSVP